MKTKRKQTIDVKEVRKQFGLNQSKFWSKIGVTQSGGSRYESGRAMPKPVEMLFNMAFVMTTREAAQCFGSLRDH